MWQISRPPANGASLDRFLNGPFVKMGCCQTAQNGPILKYFWLYSHVKVCRLIDFISFTFFQFVVVVIFIIFLIKYGG